MLRREFLLHLITEMSNFILDGNPSRMDISLHQEKDGLHLSVVDNIPRSEEEIEEISHSLNKTKRPELAGYYGSMVGHDLLGKSRLELLGWQVKHGDVSRHNDGIRIDLWVGNENFIPKNVKDSRKTHQ
jgi:hypothetical protein